MAGKGSAPGERRGGRKAGTPNKTTASVRAALEKAYEAIGDDKAFAAWALANKTEFYKLWIKMLPTSLQATITDNLTKEQRDAAVAAAAAKS